MSQLANIEKQLASAGSLRAAMSMDFVQSTFVRNYENITGRKDGEQRFQAEVFALMDLSNDNQAIAACDRFSFFAALVKAGATGLSFMDGKLYAIPYGKTLKVQISTHGKRELLNRMPDIKRVYEAQYVLKGDTFEHDKINNRVTTHISKNASPLKIENIIASYVRLEFKDKSVIDVVVYSEDINAAKNKSKAKQGGPWFDFPGEMAKKVAYNRAYKLYYQKPENIIDFANEAESEGEDVEHSVISSVTNTDDVLQKTSSGDTVDTSSGEIVNPLPGKDESFI